METANVNLSREKLPEIDILRTISIMIVVLMIHIPNNYAYNFYMDLDVFTGFLLHTLGIPVAMGSFTFISGFGLYLQNSNRNINTSDKLITFLKKRFLRIFPLYWIALLIFLIIFNEYYSGLNILYLFAHFLGLQIIFAPIFSPPIWTLWFIGVIVIYYLIFIILSYLGSLKKIISGSLVILTFFLILHFSFGLVENRFFIYYPPFIIGIIAANIYTSHHNKRIKEVLNSKHTLVIPIIISCFMLISRLVYPNLTKFCYSTFNSTYRTVYLEHILEQQINLIEFFSAILLVDMIIFVFIIFVFSMFYLILRAFSLIYDGDKINYTVSLVAYSTYGVYLFHRPFLVFFDELMLGIFNIDMFRKSNFNLILLSIPILFFLAFLIQKASDRGITIITDRLSKSFALTTTRSSTRADE
ncbi:MAG: acyltransferase family protein [Candidatus Hodarchaeales archaeon]|jgi:peptidoglycan/LPS O-acetylase OafA/YrhL